MCKSLLLFHHTPRYNKYQPVFFTILLLNRPGIKATLPLECMFGQRQKKSIELTGLTCLNSSIKSLPEEQRVCFCGLSDSTLRPVNVMSVAEHQTKLSMQQLATQHNHKAQSQSYCRDPIYCWTVNGVDHVSTQEEACEFKGGMIPN